eukprot:2654620-Rhodomonas_salina.1
MRRITICITGSSTMIPLSLKTVTPGEFENDRVATSREHLETLRHHDTTQTGSIRKSGRNSEG